MQVTTAADEDRVAIIGLGQSQSFGIDQSPETMHILADGLYQHKIQAVVRETMCNGWDGHIYAGCPERPIEITLTANEYRVRDFGNGIPKEDVHGTYCVYGYSSKRNDTNQTGGFGFGSKAPWAYSDIWTLTNSAKGENVQSVYSVVRVDPNNNGYPSLLPVVTIPVAEDNTGITVSIPIKEEDYHTFERMIRNIVFFSGMHAVLNGETLPTCPNNPDGPKPWFFTGMDSHNANGGWMVIRIGTVTYAVPDPVDADTPERARYRDIHRRLVNVCTALSLNLVMDVSHLPVRPTPSREAVQSTEIALEALCGHMEEMLQLIDQDFLSQMRHGWEFFAKNIDATVELTAQRILAANRDPHRGSDDYRSLVQFLAGEPAKRKDLNLAADWRLIRLIAAYSLFDPLKFGAHFGLDSAQVTANNHTNWQYFDKMSDLAYSMIVRGQAQRLSHPSVAGDISITYTYRNKLLQRLTQKLPKELRKYLRHDLRLNVFNADAVAILSEYVDQDEYSEYNKTKIFRADSIVIRYYKRMRRQIAKTPGLDWSKVYRMRANSRVGGNRYSSMEISPENLGFTKPVIHGETSLLELAGLQNKTVVLTRSRQGLFDAVGRVSRERMEDWEMASTSLRNTMPFAAATIDQSYSYHLSERLRRFIRQAAGTTFYEVTTNTLVSRKLLAETAAVAESFRKLGYTVVDLITPTAAEVAERDALRLARIAKKKAEAEAPLKLQSLFSRVFGNYGRVRYRKILRSNGMGSEFDSEYISDPKYVVFMPRAYDGIGQAVGMGFMAKSMYGVRPYYRNIRDIGVVSNKTDYRKALSRGCISLDELVIKQVIEALEADIDLRDKFWFHARPTSQMLFHLGHRVKLASGAERAVSVHDTEILSCIVKDPQLSRYYFGKSLSVSHEQLALITAVSSILGENSQAATMWPESFTKLRELVQALPHYTLVQNFANKHKIFPSVGNLVSFYHLEHMLQANTALAYKEAVNVRQLFKSVILKSPK